MIVEHASIEHHFNILKNKESNIFFLSRSQVAMNNCDPFVKDVVDNAVKGSEKHSVFCR